MNSLARVRQVAQRTSRLSSQIGQARRMQSEEKPGDRKSLFEMDETSRAFYERAKRAVFVKQFGYPTFFSKTFRDLYVNMRMKTIDPNFDEKQFTSECKEVSAFSSKRLFEKSHFR